MGVSQVIEGYMCGPSPGQTVCEPHSERASLAVVTGFLNAALRLWDKDQTKAKSQIKVAAAMLQDYSDEPPIETEPTVGGSTYRTCGLAPWQARKVKELIDASLDSTIKLQDCATKVHLSISYFSRAFKATFGLTVCDYIRQRRVEQAQQLMLLSREPLSQIALACGFADQA